MKKINFQAWIKKIRLFGTIGLLTFGVVQAAHAEPSQLPLFLTAPVKPLMMLNMSSDHQLFFKAYDDYTDLDPELEDGIETTYKHSYEYYGYFDSKKCYVYQNNQFEPVVLVDGAGLCNTEGSNQWNGNFLNWATMTRMDAVRKILYGGSRAKDQDTRDETVLERAFLPHDAHSFAKFYNGPNIEKLTPFSVDQELTGTQATGITLCNTTAGSGYSQSAASIARPPLIRVARGNHSLWASNERWQCRWSQGSNGNNPTATGIYASKDSPKSAVALNVGSVKNGDYNARVKVCVEGLLEDNCRVYPSGKHKPAGLLQRYGQSNEIRFGLITGSYGKNKSGGVLRKNIGEIGDEINIDTDGTFKAPPSTGGIINTIDVLRIYGYNFSDGTYGNSLDAGGDFCDFGLSGFSDGRCTNWGNPQSEIYLESLRYFAGKNAHPNFDADDSGRIAGLITASWSDPINNENYCAPLNVLQFNASTTSYDANIPGDHGLPDLDAISQTNAIGTLEELAGQYFVGENGSADSDQLCTPKTVTNLADVRGSCPDAPRLEGSYLLAGLARYARTNDLRPEHDGKQVVQTYGVALSPAVPAVTVPVPGRDRQISILPACQNNQLSDWVDGVKVASADRRREGNCAIVDFKIIESVNNSSTMNQGSVYINWEAAEQGGDYDQDMWGIINYTVTSTEVSVTTRVIEQSTGRAMGFGYVISGTEDDGFKVHSGVNNFTDNASCSIRGSCTCHSGSGTQTCNLSNPTTQTYTVGTSSANMLETPLFYAAKWGGYSKDLEAKAKEENKSIDSLVKARDASDSYFFATNPRVLEESLKSAFGRVAAQVGSASTAATSASRLNDGSKVYQAKFDSAKWDGTIQLLEYKDGALVVSKDISTDKQFAGNLNPSTRTVYVNSGEQLVNFSWDNLSDLQKNALNNDDGRGANRVNWIRGANEAGMRARTNYLGDIVNSSPVHAGKRTPRYELLPGDAGTKYKSLAKSRDVIYVGANDGMIHAFNADDLTEIFAFIPNAAFEKLATLTDVDYGSDTNPHQFIMDGSLYVSDVYVGGNWKKYLVGSMGAGGRMIFGLDVTNPGAPSLLFEFSSEQYANLGYGMVDPVIAPFNNGKWYAIFGNGSEGGRSSLFVVDLASPTAPIIVEAPEGAGITSLALLPGTTGEIQRIYAGDLSGNIWRFDTAGNASSWSVKHKVYTVTDGQGNAQPITGGITLGANSFLKGHIMVYFGTGKYFDSGDNSASATPVHSIYAIADGVEGLTGTREELFHKKSFTENGSKRTISNELMTENGAVSHAVDWVNKRGWFMDFETEAGERIIVKPNLISDRLLFTTLTPSGTACDFGGSSWAMELIAVGDRNVRHSLLDELANAKTDEMIVSDSHVLIKDSSEGEQLRCSISGECELIGVDFPDGFRGRMNWREIQ